MPPNRIVALATPLVAPLAGAFAAWLSQKVPGVDIPAGTMEEIFFVVLGVVAALALQFNHNRFKWDVEEQRATAASEVIEPDSLELDGDDDLLEDGDVEDDIEFDGDDEPDLELDEDDELDLEFDDIDDDVPAPVR
jgi:hypothetical protein